MNFFTADTLAPRKGAVLRRPPIVDSGWRPPQYYPDLSGATVIGFDTETYDPLLTEQGPGWARGPVGNVAGISVAAIWPDQTRGKWYFPVAHTVEADWNLDPTHTFAWAKAMLETPNVPKVGANLIYDIGWLQECNVHVKGTLYDVQFAEALLNEDGEVNLEHLGAKYLRTGKTTAALYEWLSQAYGGAVGPKQRANIYRAPPRLVGPYAEDDADLPLDVWRYQQPLLAAEGLLDLFRLECDLIPLFVKMRYEGVQVDLDKAEQIYNRLGGKQLELEAELAKTVGFECNVDANEHLARAFDIVGIKYPRTPASRNHPNGQPSFKKDFLKNLEHPLATSIIDVRECRKLRGTFLQGYILEGSVNSKIHCSFNPLRGDDNGTRTGRLSCVAAHTPILTHQGYKRIDRVTLADQVWTHKGRWRSVIARQIKGIEAMYTVRFSTGAVLTCTDAHRLLDAHGVWRTVGELRECFKTMGIKLYQYSNDINTLSRRKSDTNNNANSRKVRNYFSQRKRCYSPQLTLRRTQSVSRTALFCVENSRTQPNVWKKWGAASQLDRAVRGWLRLSDYVAQRQAAIRASHSNGAIARFGRIAEHLRRASYRYEHQKQRSRQFSFGYKKRSSDNSLVLRAEQSNVYITSIDYCGNHQVYDITVAEDHSYYACNVYSHNSENPNLQNIPTRSDEGALIRQAFIPDRGHCKWHKKDYSQIEYRFHVHFAVGRGSDAVRQRFCDDPSTDYHTLTQLLVQEQTGQLIKRPFIKNINFGLLYGMGQGKLARQLGLDPLAARQLFKAYHDGNPYTLETMQAMADEAQRLGYTTTVLGRRRRFNLWEPGQTDWERRATPLPLSMALAQWGSDIKRANTHKAVNSRYQGSSADQMKAGMLACWKSGVFDHTGVPRLTVHDELDFSQRDDSPITQQAYDFITHTMETIIPLRIPVKVETSYGDTWGNAK